MVLHLSLETMFADDDLSAVSALAFPIAVFVVLPAAAVADPRAGGSDAATLVGRFCDWDRYPAYQSLGRHPADGVLRGRKEATNTHQSDG